MRPAYLEIRTKFTRDNRNLALNSCRLACARARTPLKLGRNYPPGSEGGRSWLDGALWAAFYWGGGGRERAEGKLIKIPRGPCSRLIKTSDASRRSIGRLILLHSTFGDIRAQSFPSRRRRRRRADHLWDGLRRTAVRVPVEIPFIILPTLVPDNTSRKGNYREKYLPRE